MIEKIGHYSITNQATIYDEEAMTALEMAGRTAAKANECVEVVNKMEADLPGMVAQDVQQHIDNGEFDEQIDKYSGELEDAIKAVDKRQTTNLENAVKDVNARINNIVANPGDGSTPTEVVDARTDGLGTAHGSLHDAIQAQAKQVVNIYNGLVYLGGNDSVDLTHNNEGSVIIESVGRLTYRGLYGTKTLEWEETSTDIAEYVEYITAKTVRITLPAYHSFVYNVKDKLYHFRNHAVCDTYDILLVQNAYANPMRGSLVDEWGYRKTLEQQHMAYVVRGAYMYLGTGSNLEFSEDYTKEVLNVYFVGRPTLCYGNSTLFLDWTEDNLSEILSHVDIESTTRATIRIPGWNALVYNIYDKKYHFRYRANLFDGDILGIATGYCQPLCGTLLEEWNTKRTREYLAYMKGQNLASNPPEALEAFAGLQNGTDKAESFLFFTDPHLCEGDGWEAEFASYRAYLKSCYESAPLSFAVCGGDWLGNSDTQAEACFKLGFIDGQMRSTFDRYYPVVGNHDTNYQGVIDEGSPDNSGQLTDATIRNLWNRGREKNYYTFQGVNTKFFVFDTGTDWDKEMGAYRLEQVNWFVRELLNGDGGNIALAMHMYYVESLEEVNPLAEALTQVAIAYNTRSTYTLSDAVYDFSSCTGKVRFIIAGHRHGDTATTSHGIPLFVTTHTRDTNKPSFDLILADYDKNQVHAVRVGSGSRLVRTLDM